MLFINIPDNGIPERNQPSIHHIWNNSDSSFGGLQMNYISTRGKVAPETAAGAIRQGIAADGGLFAPEQITRFSEETIHSFLNKSYQELAVAILQQYLEDYPTLDLQSMVAAAYQYPAKFDRPEVTPVRELKDGQYLLDLWHGPTCAFKDVALQLLPHLLTKANQLAGEKAEIVILVATSGDTGKAALDGFKDVPGTRIIVFFPEQGVSEMQRLQMVTQEGKNTFVVAVRGNFDDAQNGVKQIFTDPVLLQKLKRNNQVFSSANSINWGRLVPQIVYYFYGYLELCRREALRFGERLNVAVPTGNFGNILAAYLAQQMGLPLGKLICASNSNNVLTEFIGTGVYDRNRKFYTTISPSMDILISSNLERLLYYLCGGDPNQVREWMSGLAATGRYQVDPGTALRLAATFYAGFASEAETKTTIERVFRETGVVIDPHTAVGGSVIEKYRRESGDRTPVLLAATASPFKFNSSVLAAILGDAAVAGVSEFTLLDQLAEISGTPVPAGLRDLNRKPVLHRSVCSKNELGRTVQEILGLEATGNRQ